MHFETFDSNLFLLYLIHFVCNFIFYFLRISICIIFCNSIMQCLKYKSFVTEMDSRNFCFNLQPCFEFFVVSSLQGFLLMFLQTHLCILNDACYIVHNITWCFQSGRFLRLSSSQNCWKLQYSIHFFPTLLCSLPYNSNGKVPRPIPCSADTFGHIY